jgi:hypothetical protein
MVKTNFKLNRGDCNAGTVYLPDSFSGRLPVVVYSHGWGGNRNISAVLDRLLGRELALVTFDYYGCGETGGDYSGMTYRRWKDNLRDIIGWVSEQPFADPNKTGCYGFSSGSTSAFRLAAEDDRIKFLISVGTCVSTHIGMDKGGPAKILADNLEHLRSGGTVEIFGTEFPLDFYHDTVSNAPFYTIDNVKCPTLILQGLADNLYRCADARMAHDILSRNAVPVKLVEIPGGDHWLDNAADEAGKAILDWLEKRQILGAES